MALGHGGKLPAGRLVIPGGYATRAIAPAAGVISTARDLLRFFWELSPRAKRSLLSAASRREMIRPQWRDPHSRIERYYGLGVISGGAGGWKWFGHSGGLQGYITRTCVLPDQELALTVLTNAADGPAHFWMEGLMHVLRSYAERGAPCPRLRDWQGRWWSLWGAIDLLPIGNRVLVALPVFFDPLADATEIEVRQQDRGRIALAGGYASHGEPARLVRDRRRQVVEVWLGGSRYRTEAAVARTMRSRYRERR